MPRVQDQSIWFLSIWKWSDFKFHHSSNVCPLWYWYQHFFMNVLKSWCFSLMNQKEPLVFLATIRPISKGLIRCPIKNEKCHRGEKYFSTFPESFRLRNGKWSSAWPFLAFPACQPVLPYILTKLFQTWTLQNEWMLFAFFSKLATLTWWQLLNKMDMSEYRCFGLQG